MPELLVPSRTIILPRAAGLGPLAARALKIPAPGNTGRFRAARFTSAGGRPRAATTDCEVCCGGEPPPTGACCRSNGQCLITEEGACLSLPGTWLGPNTTCAGNPCGPPPAACCTSTRCWNQCSTVGPVVVSILAVATCTLQRCCPGNVVVTGQFNQTISNSRSFSAGCAAGQTGMCTLSPSVTATGTFPVPGSIAQCDSPGVISFGATAFATNGPGGVPGWSLSASIDNCNPASVFAPGCTGGSGGMSCQSQLANCGPNPNYRLSDCTFQVTVQASGRYACPGASASLRGVSLGEIEAARATIGALRGAQSAERQQGGCSGCGGSGSGVGGALI